MRGLARALGALDRRVSGALERLSPRQLERAGPLRIPVRLGRALGVVALGLVILAPNLPGKWLPDAVNRWNGELAGKLRQISFVQSWRMYAPNPQRAQTYMNLTAHYADGSSAHLEETRQEQQGWHTTWAWRKTRMDIWRHYANFRPKQVNEHRKWYLRGVCVREARRGTMPDKITMEHVTRRFAKPHKVRRGAPGLGRFRRRLITVQYCKVKRVRMMLEADAALRAG